MYEIAILCGLGLVAMLLIVLLVRRTSVDKEVAQLSGQLGSVQTEVQSLMRSISTDSSSTRAALHDELSSIRATVEQSRNAMDSQMTNLQTSYSNITLHLGKLEQVTGDVEQLSKNVLGLQDILTKPRNRGGFGELYLQLDLADTLPAACFETQYPFPGCSERVDAVIKLPQGMVAIDAKFPLESYQQMRDAITEEAQKTFSRAFIKSLKDRMVETAKYIRPHDGTLNFALMYVPSEAVFYEFFVMNAELGEISQQLRVFAVSPNTLDLYLKTVAIGLKGLQIEADAQKVLHYLEHLTRDFGSFDVMLDTAITHLAHAQAKLGELQKKHAMVMLKAESLELNGSGPQLTGIDENS